MLRINALGCLSVAGDGGVVAGAAAQPKRLAILALLVRAGERGITRDKILSFLWPDSDSERARRLLAQALYMLRRDLGSEEVVTGTKDLRLNPDLITSDVAEFGMAIAEGRLEHAVSLYAGPFLDGFRLAGAPEFERWAESERVVLTHDYAAALEKLASSSAARGQHAKAADWWRKLAAQDPLSARYALGVMQALDAAGDRSGAIQHARIYEAFVAQELDLEADPGIAAYAERLRAAPPGPGTQPASHVDSAPRAKADGTPAPSAPAVAAAGASSEPLPAGTEPVRLTPGELPRSLAWRWALGAVGAVALLAIVILAGDREDARGVRSGETPVIALGHIADYTGAAGGASVEPLTDMLATNLARIPALRVVSTARMYEVLSQLGGARDTTASALVSAARRAGATELLDGALYDLGAGNLRLDLRRIELATGSVRASHSVSGATLFILADSGTARLAAEFGAARPPGSVADVTTPSLAAYRLYEQGLHAYYENDKHSAERLFGAALDEDSTFAMAAYYRARSSVTEPMGAGPELERAVRLASRVSERERLTIHAAWAMATSSPSLRATAETLATRYPQEVEGHLYSGVALVVAGDFMPAVPHLQRAIAMDSLGLSGERAGCSACDAFRWLVSAYHLADSLPAAEREARRWTRLQPRSPLAWWVYGELLTYLQRGPAALGAFRTAASLEPSRREGVRGSFADVYILLGQLDSAEALLREQLASTEQSLRAEANWYLSILHREQGRIREALVEAQRSRELDDAEPQPNSIPPSAILHAQVLLDADRPRESAALFDSISRLESDWRGPSFGARSTVWMLTHTAAGLAAAGDTAPLAAIAERLESLSGSSGYGRDRRLYHHIRGLLLAARGDDEAAIAEFRQAIYSTTAGYTRTNLELARALLRRARPREAVAVLQAALRGGIESSNLYVTRTELYELLAQSWEQVDAAAARDSARVHYAAVADRWARGDPSFAARAAEARRKVRRIRGDA